MTEPIGSLCVRQSDGCSEWIVSICQGDGERQILRRFGNRTAAAEFAIEERARRVQGNMNRLTIHFPDECPCNGAKLIW
jgi:hypothetical protein